MKQLGVSENGGTPKSSILIGLSIINHPFWGTPVFGNTQLELIDSSHIMKTSRKTHPGPRGVRPSPPAPASAITAITHRSGIKSVELPTI